MRSLNAAPQTIVLNLLSQTLELQEALRII